MADKKLSIIVPVYDEADGLASLVQEIHETFEQRIAYELIVVNDGSEDSTQEVFPIKARAWQLSPGLKPLRLRLLPP